MSSERSRSGNFVDKPWDESGSEDASILDGKIHARISEGTSSEVCEPGDEGIDSKGSGCFQDLCEQHSNQSGQCSEHYCGHSCGGDGIDCGSSSSGLESSRSGFVKSLGVGVVKVLGAWLFKLPLSKGGPVLPDQDGSGILGTRNGNGE